MTTCLETCLETFEKERFGSYTAMPQENQRLETRHVGAAKRAFRARLPPCSFDIFDTLSNRLECHKVPRLPRKTTWQPEKERFCSFPHRHGEATGKQRLETRHVGASKRACRVRLPPILTLCSLKIDVFLRVFLGTSKFATSKSMFRAKFPSIFSTSHKMPHLPRNLHLVATWCSPANAICRKHATRHV